MTNEISTQKRKDFENKIKMNYTKNKIKSLVTDIDTDDKINLVRFINLANKRLKEIDNAKLQNLYAKLLLQAKIAIDYNKKIEEKISKNVCNIDMDLLLYTESELIRDELRSAIDRLTHPSKEDTQAYQDIIICRTPTPIGNMQRLKPQNVYEYMTNPLIYDMRSLYNESKSPIVISSVEPMEEKASIKDHIAQEMEL